MVVPVDAWELRVQWGHPRLGSVRGRGAPGVARLWAGGRSSRPVSAHHPGSATPGQWGWAPRPGLPAVRGSPGQLLQLGLGVVQAVTLHVLVGSVGQQLVQRQDVPGDLWPDRQGEGAEAGMGIG